MDLQAIESRVKELEQAVERSAISHNITLGQLGEAKHLLDLLKNGAQKVEAVAQKVEQTVDAVEQVVDTSPASNN